MAQAKRAHSTHMPALSRGAYPSSNGTSLQCAASGFGREGGCDCPRPAWEATNLFPGTEDI
jgi:hypothetical protein